MSTDNQTIRVRKTENYAVIDKQFLDDDARLSWKAKGLLAYLLAKPDNWKIRITDLVKRSADGKDSVYSGLKELEQCGYLERKMIRQGGKFTGYESVVHERPVVEPFSPHRENPDTVKPFLENPPVVSNELLNIKSSKKQQRPVVDIVEKDTPVSNPGSGEIEEIIRHAESRGFTLETGFASALLNEAGGLTQARNAVDRAVKYAVGRKDVRNPAGLIMSAIHFDKGAKFNANADERQKRLEEKEEKYRDIYLS